MSEGPRTLEEWAAYAATLEGEDLFEKVKAANGIVFIQELKGRGMKGSEIRGVFEIFVRRLVACRELPPAGGYFDLRQMMVDLGLQPQDETSS